MDFVEEIRFVVSKIASRYMPRFQEVNDPDDAIKTKRFGCVSMHTLLPKTYCQILFYVSSKYP